MTDGRNLVAELEAKMDGKDREIERLRSDWDCLNAIANNFQAETVRLDAEIERLRAALREVDSQLTNMQPHIASLEEHCGNVGRTRFIDDHVDAALDVARKALEGKDG